MYLNETHIPDCSMFYLPQPEESSSKNDANRSSGGSGGGGEGLMQEMHAILARRLDQIPFPSLFFYFFEFNCKNR